MDSSADRRALRHWLLLGALVAWPACASSVRAESQSPWVLVWSDEFNASRDSPPDPANWSYDLGDGCSAGICGWGNRERQTYTRDASNAKHTGSGQLAITARVAPPGLACHDGPCRYTSARIRTQGRMTAGFGRVEARIRLPAGQGLWPAFWMLGEDFPATPWPRCGEIDIMEFRGSRPREVSSALHGPGYSGETPLVHHHTLSSGGFADDYHRFAVEWEGGEVRFFVDDSLHYTVRRSDVAAHGPWAFDRRFFVILNLAVGGKFDGDPRSDAIFPATMLVDYVRVYTR